MRAASAAAGRFGEQVRGTPPASRLAAWAIAAKSTAPSEILPVVGKFMGVMLAGYVR